MDGLVGYASGDSENSPSPSPNPPPPQWPRGVPKVKPMESKDANLMEEWQSFEKLIGEDMKSSEVTDDPKKKNLPRRSHSSSDSSRSRSRSKSSASSHSSSSRSRSNSPAKKSKLKKKKSRSSSSSSSDSDSDKPPSKHSSSDSDEEPEPVKVKLASKSPPPVAAAAATPAAPIVHRISSRSRSRSPHRRRRSRSRDRRRRRSGSRSRRRRGRRRRSHSRHRSRSGDRKDKADGDKQTGDSHDRRRSRSRDRRRHGRRRSRSRSRDRRRKRHRGERSWRRSHRKRRRSADHKKRSRSKSPIHKKKNEPMTFKEKLKQSLLEVQKQAAAGEKPATDKLTTAQLAAMSGGQVTPQQALLQTMAAMHQKAQELTGVAVPKYYNPAAVNPLKYAEQVQKRKLLWAKKGPATNPAMPGPSMSQPGPQAIPATAGCSTKPGEDPYGQNTMFLNDSDGKTAEKFRKLMGIKEEEKTTVYTNADMVKKQDELFDNLDKEYAFARMATHTHRGVGLGFTSQVYFPK